MVTNLSTKQINIGIIGSSFSTGRDDVRFEDWFIKNSSIGANYINLACGGKGSEKFLSSIIYLKKTYDIQCVLMELVHNRKNLNIDLSGIYNQEIDDVTMNKFKQTRYKKFGFHDFESHLQHDDGIFSLWQTRPFDRNLDWSQQSKKLGIVSPLKDVQKWHKFQLEIASNWKMKQINTLFDYDSVIDLCDLLNIKLYSWRHNKNNDFQLNAISDLIPNLNVIHFGEYDTAQTYYERLYPDQQILHDGCHFINKMDQEMVINFLLPAVESAFVQNK